MHIDLRLGDSFERLKEIPDNSVAASISDPPYGISFMGAEWDDLGAVKRANRGDHTKWKRMPGESSKAPKFRTHHPAFDLNLESSQRMQVWHETWLTEVYRVLRPGGVVKAFSATRTFHRLAAAMEDAGFVEVQLESWGYASGFPKSKSLALFIDKHYGHGNRGRAIPTASTHLPNGKYETEKLTSNRVGAYIPQEREAQEWNGWGTALKPAWEPFVVGRKP